MAAIRPASFLSGALFFTVLLFVAAQNKSDSTGAPPLVVENESEDVCAPEGFWNDSESNTYTVHLRIVGENYVLHLTQNPLDDGVVVKNIKPDKHPLKKLFLRARLDGTIKIYLYMMEDGGKMSASTWTVDENKISDEQFGTIADFGGPVSDIADVFRENYKISKIYNRATCLNTPDSTVATLCNETCRLGSGLNCVHDQPLQWTYFVKEHPRENLTNFFVSYGCNLQYERPVDVVNQKNQLIVFKPNAKDRSVVDISAPPSCYNVVGFFNQVVDRNWTSGLSSCSTFPIKELHVDKKFEQSDESNKMLTYIGIAVGVIVVFITLAGLYVYCCSDDEIDELLPPPGTAPEDGATPGAPPADGAPAPAPAPAT